ncbi:MAG: thiosulfate oxidation carrier protein SoxY [Gammaproteobacteria bacterium]|nr:thiosulfate oxidation carrier protein SoxY [Gammaproteobacteria bacterium]MCP5146393.1 thiosulfate oxidation carrier protein SoxY [Gammaproteobacteria bacterium]
MTRLVGLGSTLLALVTRSAGSRAGERPQAAFAARDETTVLAELFGSAPAQVSSAIRIDVASFIADGAVVPLQVSVDTLHDVSSIAVIAPRNPVLLVAHFELHPRALPEVATRIKLAMTQEIVVAAQTSAGVLLNRRRVEVARGGCA